MLVADWVVALPLPPWLIIIAVLLILMAMGCFVDALAMVLLTIPIFYPAALKLGFDGTWFGVIMTLALGMGVLTPPVGANVYVVYSPRLPFTCPVLLNRARGRTLFLES
jgi:TRAP-type C4-dicarboxylate transport system permease large subunit